MKVSHKRQMCARVFLSDNEPCLQRASRMSVWCGGCGYENDIVGPLKNKRTLLAEHLQVAALDDLLNHSSGVSAQRLDRLARSRPACEGLLVADHPAADESTLRWLLEFFTAARADDIISEALCEAVFPTLKRRDVIKHMKYRLLAAIAGNPACSLAFLSELLTSYKETAASFVVCNPGVDSSILRRIINSGCSLSHQSLYALASHPQLRGKALTDAVAKLPLDVVSRILGRDDLPQEAVTAIWDRGSADDTCRQTILRWHQELITPAMFEYVIGKQNRYQELARQIAENSTTPPDVLERLISDHDAKWLPLIAANPSATADILRRLAASPSSRVREAVLSNPNVPSDMIKPIIRSFSVFELMDAAARRSMPANKLTMIWNEQGRGRRMHGGVGAALAGNPSVPSGTLEQIAATDDHATLKALARNPSTPVHILERLANRIPEGRHPIVRAEIFAALARNRSSTPEILLQVMDFAESEEMRAAERNTSQAERISHLLETCFLSIASNPNTTGSLLTLLAFGGTEAASVATERLATLKIGSTV